MGSAVWLAFGVYEKGDSLCASYIQIEEEKPDPRRWDHLFERKTEDRSSGIVRAKMEPFLFRETTRPTMDCIPTAEDRRIAWGVRQSSLAFIVGPPFAVLVLGVGLLWGIRGFRQPN